METGNAQSGRPGGEPPRRLPPNEFGVDEELARELYQRYLTPEFLKGGYKPQVRRRRSFREWWNWRVAGAVAIVVLAAGGVVGSMTAYLNVTHDYVRHHVFISGEGEPVKASAAAGETIWVGVEASSLGAKWSTDTGISLHLSGRPAVVLHGPKQADWGDTVSTSSNRATRLP
jgi:hypothetical protein